MRRAAESAVKKNASPYWHERLHVELPSGVRVVEFASNHGVRIEAKPKHFTIDSPNSLRKSRGPW